MESPFCKRRFALMGTKTLDAPAEGRVMDVYTKEDFKRFVVDESEKIVVVRFHARYCKACKAVAVHFDKLASMHPECRFINVESTASNTDLIGALGVPSLPFGHVYHPSAGLVEESRITRKVFKFFADRVQSHVDGSCNVIDDDPMLDPYAPRIDKKSDNALTESASAALKRAETTDHLPVTTREFITTLLSRRR